MTRIAAFSLVLALVMLSTAAFSRQPGNAAGSSLESPVRSVLKEAAYPWYDGKSDTVKPLLPDPTSWSGWLDRLFDRPETVHRSGGSAPGNVLPTVLFVATGCLLLVLLWRLWRLYEPVASQGKSPSASIGEAARIAGLTSEGSMAGSDPWAEAQRHRAAGNQAMAVIWLFFHQLLELDRAGLIHVSSGKTGRQYVSTIGDPLLSEGLRETLAVFEQVYYGHRIPDDRSFERVWSAALAFRGRMKAIDTGTRR